MYKYLLILLLVFTFPSCLKEDLSTISDVEINSTWIIPLVDMEIDFTDLMRGEELVSIDDDSLIHIIYKIDSVNSIEAEEIIDLSISESVSKNHQLGALELDNMNSQLSINLIQLAENIGNDFAQTLITASTLPQAYFPPIASIAAGVYNYDPFADFNLVNLESGMLSLSLENGLPIPIQELSLTLFNTVTLEIISVFEFTNLDPNMIQTLEQPINDGLVNNNISMMITNFITPGCGPNPEDITEFVSVDLFDELQFTVLAYDLVADDGLIVFPSTELESDNLSMPLNLEDDISISKGVIEQGDLLVSYQSSVSHPILLSLEIPSLKSDGQIYSEQFVLNNTFGFEVEQEPEDLLNYELTVESITNEIQVNVQFELISNGQILDYNSSDELNINLAFENVKFNYVEGDFGQTTHEISQGIISLGDNFTNQMGEGFFFEEPKLTLRTNNGFGIPMMMDLNLYGYTEAEEVIINATDLPIHAPSISQGTTGIITINELNVNNSNISELINAQVNEIHYDGLVMTNPDGMGDGNSLFTESSLNLDIELDIPLYMRMSQMQFTDSMKLSPSDDGFGEEFQLRTFIKNDFPFDAKVTLLFRDSLVDIALDSLLIDDVSASVINNEGELIEASLYDRTLKVNGSQLDAIKNANQMIARIDLNTIDEQVTPIKIYSDYKVNINVGVVVEIDN